MYIIFVTLVAAMGGLLFGYDTGVINGANVFLRDYFEIASDAQYGWACSCALVGCIIGAAGGGYMGDFLGRRKSLLVCAVLFAISAIGSAIPNSVNEFVIYRIIGGIGVGAASLLSPMYIAEMAPSRLRGRLVSVNQLAIVLGILVAFFANYFIQNYGDGRLAGQQAWNVAYGWRWMFGLETVAAVVFFLMLFFVPDSPRFLMARKKKDAARAILGRMATDEEVTAQISEIEVALSEEKGTLADLLRPGMKIALLIGIALAVFQQWSGINAIMYYSTNVFKEAGLGRNAAFVSSVGVGVTNLALTCLGIALVDRLGRKPLLIIGSVVQAVALTTVAIAFAGKSQGVLVLVAVLVYVGAFAFSLGPVTWVVLSEIFPTKIRGRAMSIATLILWIACYLLSQTFPVFLNTIGASGTFAIYAGISLMCAVFVAMVLPETKGMSLEEIEGFWSRRK